MNEKYCRRSERRETRSKERGRDERKNEDRERDRWRKKTRTVERERVEHIVPAAVHTHKTRNLYMYMLQ
jgi:hypothetical protein